MRENNRDRWSYLSNVILSGRIWQSSHVNAVSRLTIKHVPAVNYSTNEWSLAPRCPLPTADSHVESTTTTCTRATSCSSPRPNVPVPTTGLRLTPVRQSSITAVPHRRTVACTTVGCLVRVVTIVVIT